MDAELRKPSPDPQSQVPELMEGLADVAEERAVDAGQVILEEGGTGDELYLILEGRVEVTRSGDGEPVVLAERGRGDFFGEMGLIEGRPRFATVRALDPTRLLVFSEADLRAAWPPQPGFAFQILRLLSARLREADLKMIADLQRKNMQLSRRLRHELELARQIQRSMLPRVFSPVRGAVCAARSRPAREVGGDFYDVIPLDPDRTGLVIADVSDKGLSAALYMALARSVIRSEASHHRSPREALLTANQLLLEMIEATMFVTVFYGVLEQGARRLRYVRAGHNYPILYDPLDHTCRQLRGQGIVLGCLRQVDLEEVVVDLSPGDVLVLYSDGITDANSATGEFFGMERLEETVCGADGMAPEDVCNHVFDRVDRFQGEGVQFDDMAVLVTRTTDE